MRYPNLIGIGRLNLRIRIHITPLIGMGPTGLGALAQSQYFEANVNFSLLKPTPILF